LAKLVEMREFILFWTLSEKLHGARQAPPLRSAWFQIEQRIWALSGAMATTESVWPLKKVVCAEEPNKRNMFFHASSSP
jgi:hypothetical protein